MFDVLHRRLRSQVAQLLISLSSTALGLAAAIPAVVAYNRFSSQIETLASRLETFSGEFSTILSRQLDER